MRKNTNFRTIKEGGLTHIHTEMSKDAIMKFDEIGDYIKRNMTSSYFTVGDHLTSPYKEKRYSKEEIRDVIEAMLQKVAQYNETHEKPKCISGVEANIVTDGVDIPDSLLERIDFVIASRHAPWGNEGAQQIVKNLVAVMENPHVDAIGHVNRHTDVSVDWDTVFQTAEKTRILIEINFDTPPSEEILRAMSKHQLLYTIGIDFHAFPGLKNRVPINSQVVTDISEAKKIIRQKTELSEPLMKEYSNEPIGYNVLKKLVTIMRRLEAVGISQDKIVNMLGYDDFMNFIKRPKNERTHL